MTRTAGILLAALAASPTPPPAAASETVVVTCSIGYPAYTSGTFVDVTGECTLGGTPPRPAVLTVTAVVGPGCVVGSASGWLIGADSNYGLSWTRVADAGVVSLQSPAGAGVVTFTRDDPAKVCGVHAGPATETAVFTLTTF